MPIKHSKILKSTRTWQAAARVMMKMKRRERQSKMSLVPLDSNIWPTETSKNWIIKTKMKVGTRSELRWLPPSTRKTRTLVVAGSHFIGLRRLECISKRPRWQIRAMGSPGMYCTRIRHVYSRMRSLVSKKRTPARSMTVSVATKMRVARSASRMQSLLRKASPMTHCKLGAKRARGRVSSLRNSALTKYLVLHPQHRMGQ